MEKQGTCTPNQGSGATLGVLGYGTCYTQLLKVVCKYSSKIIQKRKQTTKHGEGWP